MQEEQALPYQPTASPCALADGAICCNADGVAEQGASKDVPDTEQASVERAEESDEDVAKDAEGENATGENATGVACNLQGCLWQAASMPGLVHLERILLGVL